MKISVIIAYRLNRLYLEWGSDGKGIWGMGESGAYGEGADVSCAL